MARVSIAAIAVGLFAIAVGIFLSPLPCKLGFYTSLASLEPKLTGLTPIFLNDDQWGYTFDQIYQHDLTGQTAIVTGANSGVGFETALGLAKLGAAVTLACRNEQRCQVAAERIRSNDNIKGNVSTMTIDTSSLTSVKRFADSYLQLANENEEQPAALDMLYLNAGIISAGKAHDGSALLSEDGIEMVFATNHVGHHLLYKLLEPAVLRSKMARVVLTSSAGSFYPLVKHKVATDLQTLNGVRVNAKSSWEIYGQSKLAQILFAKQLTKRLGPNSTVYVNALHPGAVDTPIIEKNPFIPAPMQRIVTYARENFMWNATEGAFNMLYLGVATDELVEKNIRGKFFHPQALEVVNPLALDEDLQKKVWDFTDELVKNFV